ncbi:MAG: PEP-CTERM sorting domain-containing protein [Chthoniobacterales bacterium]|nr:PEP-CTERM sorting domain-containing protein [Chthoniobacterales bacterium]
MKLLSKIALTIALVAGITAAAQAQISYTGTTYTQNANSFLGTSATVPVGWAYAFTGTSVFNGVGTGTSGTGGAWAYGLLGENSFGALRSGTPGNITLSVNFTNSTGSTLTDLVVMFNYEQWRYANTSGWNLSGTGGLTGVAAVNSADFTGGAIGVNGTPTSIPINLTLTGLSIPNGATFGFSWLTTDASGSDNGISVDDFSLSAIPEPSVYMLLGVGLLFCGQRFLRRKRA